jgi:DNA-binding response OmpR family regulator
MNKQRRILVVDDEVKTVEVLQAYLAKEGYDVLTAYNGKDALRHFKEHDVALVVLDLMLPDISGEDICRDLRRQSRVPIVMLTAKIEERDFLNGLDIGADDYLMKPISPRAVVAKVKAILRRVECDELVATPIMYNNGELSIDFANGVVKKNGEAVSLTPTENKLLATMAKAPNRVFSRSQLIDYALGDEYDGYDRTIDTYIMGLRSKIEPDRKKPTYITTVHGIGYKFQILE